MPSELPGAKTADVIHEEGLRPPRARRGARLVRVAGVVAAGALVCVGLVGATRYWRNFWLYRGFPPPRDPAFVTAGTASRFYVSSAALGGRRQPVDVYLPPGYRSHPDARYPVMYLLHGFPGRPGAFLQTVRLGVVEDVLVHSHRIRPFIIVMPFGSTGTFTDKEWANGIRPHEGWETFVARDLVRSVDARYRTVRGGSGRVLAGLSEGGYGALNIGFHHPGEFRVLESWSGYERASNLTSIFGGDPALLRANSPLDTLGHVAARLRRTGTYVWAYSGTTDSFDRQNAAFAAALARARIPHRYRVVRGGHNWAIWRAQAADALIVAARRLGAGTAPNV
jgi:enterochelin esterase-like enzyme